MSSNEGRVYFALDGDDFNPDELTTFIGIEPTSVMYKGEKIPDKVPARSSWQLSSENIVDEYIDIFAMANTIIDLLEPKKEIILKAIEQFSLTPRLEVVLWISMDEEVSTPAIGFESDVVSFLGEIGAFIDIDTYKNA